MGACPTEGSIDQRWEQQASKVPEVNLKVPSIPKAGKPVTPVQVVVPTAFQGTETIKQAAPALVKIPTTDSTASPGSKAIEPATLVPAATPTASQVTEETQQAAIVPKAGIKASLGPKTKKQVAANPATTAYPGSEVREPATPVPAAVPEVPEANKQLTPGPKDSLVGSPDPKTTKQAAEIPVAATKATPNAATPEAPQVTEATTQAGSGHEAGMKTFPGSKTEKQAADVPAAATDTPPGQRLKTGGLITTVSTATPGDPGDLVPVAHALVT